MGNLSFDTDFLAVGAEIAEQRKTSPGSNNGQLRLKMTNLAILQKERWHSKELETYPKPQRNWVGALERPQASISMM